MLQITEEQARLLENVLRVKIMHALAGEPLTSKQVADRLGKTPGNIHYHLQKLYEGGLVELVRTEVSGGVVQKFYRSPGTWFNWPGSGASRLPVAQEQVAERLTSRLSLSDADFRRFRQEMMELIARWEAAATDGEEYGLEVTAWRLEASSDKEGERP